MQQAGPMMQQAASKASSSGGGLNEKEIKYLADKVSFLDKSVAKFQKLGDAIESRMGGAISSAGFGRTAKRFQAAVRRATMGVVQAWSQLYLFVIVLLVLFIIHQLFVWIDEDPDVAFERAALIFDYTEVGWDMGRILWNGGVDVFNAGVIPIWNAGSYYLVEPAVTLCLEVFSLIFMQRHWEGIMTEEDFPYNGLDCMASAESAAWCGRYGSTRRSSKRPSARRSSRTRASRSRGA